MRVTLVSALLCFAIDQLWNIGWSSSDTNTDIGVCFSSKERLVPPFVVILPHQLLPFKPIPKLGKILFDFFSHPVYVVRSNLSQSIKEGLHHIDASDCAMQ
jgi:hypothetical protein